MPAPLSSDLHRAFIQALLSRRTLPEKTAQKLYRRACQAVQETSDEHFEPPYDPASLEGLVGFLGELSEQLAPLGFEIKRTREDSDQGLTWITLVNVDAGGDVDKDQAAGLAQLASDLTPLEISFYREIISAIVESYPANSIATIKALAFRKELPTAYSTAQAERALKVLVSRGWLQQSKRYRISLSPRALAELDSWLKQTYGQPDNEDAEAADEGGSLLKACANRACETLVFQGWSCQSENCDAHVHLYCRASRVAVQRDTCPRCRIHFSHPVSRDGEPRADFDEPVVEPVPVGEAAVVAGQGAPTVQQRKRKNAVAESSDGEESAEEAVQGHQVEEEEEVDELAGESLEAVPRPVKHARTTRSTR